MGISGPVLLPTPPGSVRLWSPGHSLVILSWFPLWQRSMGRLLRNDLRFQRGLRRVMNHRVGVFHPNAVSSGLRSKQLHQRVVVLLFRPIALPFEQRRDGRETHRAGLHHARERGLLRAGRRRAATILD